MEVILKQDIEKLGKAGTIVEVKDGYARNFLLPNNLAVQKTAQNIKKLEEQEHKKLKQQEKIKKESEELKQRLSNISLTIPVLTKDDDRLYAGINTQNIANALKEEGLEISKNLIALDEPIKTLGIYEIKIKLHPEVTAEIKVWVVKK